MGKLRLVKGNDVLGTRQNVTQAPTPAMALWTHPAGLLCAGTSQVTWPERQLP